MLSGTGLSKLDFHIAAGRMSACAVARKLAIVMHRMWLDGTDFQYGQSPLSLPDRIVPA